MPTELANREPQQMAAQPLSMAELPQTPMEMLAHAVKSGNTAMVETLSRLAQQSRDKDEVAAFNRSMHAAQGEMKRIGADATNPQTRSRYVTFSKLDAALRPIYTQHGFSVSFNTAPGPNADTLRVIAYVSHEQGYTREYQIDMPADGKGAKGGDVMTKTHATGAAASYGARYLLKMIFNVAVGESDDDGNGANGPRAQRMDESRLRDYIDNMQSATTFEELKTRFGPAYKVAADLHDSGAMAQLQEFYESKKARLR